MVVKTSEIAFMFPPATDEVLSKHHLGVAYIQAFLKKNGITSEQVIPAYGNTLDDYVEQLIATNAGIFGFTCYDYNYYLVRSISKLLKHRKPDCFVIVGGPTATFSDELILRDTPDIDLCVRFEGEETTLELVNCRLGEASLNSFKDIKGVTYRQDNSIIRNPDRELIGSRKNEEHSLDVLPSPYLEGIFKGIEGAGILTARGCTRRCTYCNFSAISKHTVRYHSIDRIIAELHYIQRALEKTPSSTVFINDDDFSINIRRAKEICERIIDEGIKLRLSCLCRADNLDEELIKLLCQAGVSKIIFGLESATPKILRNIKKISDARPASKKEDFAPEKIFLLKAKEAISLAKKYNMHTEVSIILGLPGETIEDGLETIEFVRNLGVNAYAQNYLEVYRGTELFDTAVNYGIKIKPSYSLLPYDVQYAYPVQELPFLNNSSFQLDLFNKARIILRAFAGGPDTCTGSENGIVLALIEGLGDNDSSDIFSWLSQYLAVRGIVVIIGKDADTFKDFKTTASTSYKCGLPTHRLYYLKNYSLSGSETIYGIVNKPLNGELLQWNPRFPLIEFSKCLEFSKKQDIIKSQSWLIYCLAEKKDVRFLAALAHSLGQHSNECVKGFWLDGILQDGCRWSKGLCPALRLRRVVINKNREILPCINGKPLGTLAENIQELRKNASEIYAKIYEERGCSDCPADSNCSKCLFPYPLSQQEYCNLQRSDLDLSGIVVRSKMINIFDKFSEEDI